MKKNELIYIGKAKKIYYTNDTDILRVVYLDQITALNGLKKDKMIGKGQLNNQISSLIFNYLNQFEVPNHFIKQINRQEQLVKKVEIILLEVVVRNYAAGSLSERLGIEEGSELTFPVLEFYYKKDKLGDPMINDNHIQLLNIATKNEINQIKQMALTINQLLLKLFDQLSIRLIDFKLEFGRDKDGKILLADEISPDTCRLWDKQTNERLDKDLYRKDKGNVLPVYQQVLQRLQKIYQ
ncbi:phosphoribosylaminoimidazolesuccinocarboxamide synthase [Melissococcus plutonius]|uniref:phosphoribosylaminoimidazolesuccinocarboxamide synthase n=1 Tax=Melissococcus plutonius TaxID=33970 RepID=UPI000F846773|nr:phosphoribosylaminoimidazolesuccinocarboxamide synthase [Melissococcus plutonius]MCV2499313.1 phosphoribosylaminoimidazolesuccinocarboxamide synthase [Melissococcus plutonius]MCV2505616.1 phosphoribosylaminoimidazolesuccinocarboxamide synthase [Melissococcus plutonius]MCV2507923.1 phosphoribosylaminoimidazolesuccinocarboxamide synthase [Melissococcus plutonius]MCV2520359.1 phosphoribosylaminoimidazolesuccinocarboxamide synthase [Melissococcus plutonius]MCV2527749.1 phosphoribosylaminoimidaz